MKDTENIGIENIDIETAINLKASIDRTLTAIETFNTGVLILMDEVKQKNKKLEKMSKRGQSDMTLLIGVDDDKLAHAVELINSNCKTRTEQAEDKKVKVSGATLFVTDVERFEKM